MTIDELEKIFLLMQKYKVNALEIGDVKISKPILPEATIETQIPASKPYDPDEDLFYSSRS